jgi:hypothetical protein
MFHGFGVEHILLPVESALTSEEQSVMAQPPRIKPPAE